MLKMWKLELEIYLGRHADLGSQYHLGMFPRCCRQLRQPATPASGQRRSIPTDGSRVSRQLLTLFNVTVELIL